MVPFLPSSGRKIPLEGKVPNISSGRRNKVMFSLLYVFPRFSTINMLFLVEFNIYYFFIWFLKIYYFTVYTCIESWWWIIYQLHLNFLNIFLRSHFWNPRFHPGPRPSSHSIPLRRGCLGRVRLWGGMQWSGPHSTFLFLGSQLACGFYVQGYLFSNQRHWVGTSGGKLVALGSFEASQVGGFCTLKI